MRDHNIPYIRGGLNRKVNAAPAVLYVVYNKHTSGISRGTV